MSNHGAPGPKINGGPETSAVTRFAAAWARSDLTGGNWAAEIYPLCTPRYGALLRSINPAEILARQVTGAPTQIQRQPGRLT